MVKRIYILRHGETQWNKEDVFRGRSDIPLNETGLKQAEMASFYFKNKEIDFIFSSPLLRAMQTAKAVSKTTEKDVEIVEEFIDINFGIWEGLTVKEVERNYPHDFAIWVKNPQKLNLRGGETLETVRK